MPVVAYACLAPIGARLSAPTACNEEGTEKVDGVDTLVLSYLLEMPGAPAAKAKLKIGKADGLPYAQTAEGVNTTYTYKQLPPPKI